MSKKPHPHIAILGYTGVGKSSFINRVTGRDDATEGQGLYSCTQEINDHAFKLNGQQGIILDTPGFGDTNISDSRTLITISKYLKKTYEEDFKLTALFYLIDIDAPRMSGPLMKNLLLFEKLCGKDNLKNVVFVTTKWDKGVEQDFEKKETQLREGFLKEMLELGARTERHDNSTQSAQAIVHKVLDAEPTPTKIQVEMVDEGKDLGDTEVGRAAKENTREEMEKREAEFRVMLEECRDMGKKELEDLKGQHEEEMKKLREAQERLQQPSIGEEIGLKLVETVINLLLPTWFPVRLS